MTAVHSDWLQRGLHRLIMKTALPLFLGLFVLSFGDEPATSSVSRANSTVVEASQMTRRIFDESVNGQTIYLAIGHTMEIRLRENPTTGFRWRLMSSDPAVCAMTSDTFKLDSNRPGHGGEHSWVFEAVRPGECNIELRYQRPWANAALPKRMLQIFIHVENPERGGEPGH